MSIGAGKGRSPKPRCGDLQKFLAERVVQVAPGAGAPIPDDPDGIVTVVELVSHYANRLGGVHYDPTPGKAVLVKALEQSAIDLNLTMSAIGRIVIRALDPLAARLFMNDLGLYGATSEHLHLLEVWQAKNAAREREKARLAELGEPPDPDPG
jgi:hypothetical protein